MPEKPRALPKAVLAPQRVIAGARRPGDPQPPRPNFSALPNLRPERASPTAALGAPASFEPIRFDLDELDVDVGELEQSTGTPVPPPAATREPTTQLPAICTYGRFDILGRIAFGGMAEIFLGREGNAAGSSRLLAIKRILPHVADDPQFVEMFLDEARLAIQLNHPYICHIYEFGELEGTYFIAMEWISGAQLGKIIRRARHKGGMSPEIGARIIACVADALHYAHRARDANGQPLGIVHRDVSPHNVMVSYDGQVKLLDFGIAKAQTHTTKTQAGVIKGKFSYMSPQQCLGKNVDARADVFALGICLYEVLTGETLYHRSTEYETMRAVIEDPVPSIRDVKPDLPAELDGICQKALQKRPEDRWGSAGEMQAAIEEYLAKTGRAITTARIGEMMELLFEDRILAGPLVDSTPFGQSFRRRTPGPSTGPGSGPHHARSGSHARAETGGEAPTLADEPSRPSGEAAAIAADRSWDAAEPGATAVRPRRALITLIGIAVIALLGSAIALVVMVMPRREEAAATTSVAPPAPVPSPGREPAPEEIVNAEPPNAPATIVLRGIASSARVQIGERTLSADELAEPIALRPGTHLLHVEHAEYRPYDREVTIAAGASQEIQVTLVPRERTPAAPPGRLSINTRPWSKIYVGSRLLGTTPIGEAEVPSGNVRLRIVDRDGRTFSRSVRVRPGGAETLFLDLDAE